MLSPCDAKVQSGSSIIQLLIKLQLYLFSRELSPIEKRTAIEGKSKNVHQVIGMIGAHPISLCFLTLMMSLRFYAQVISVHNLITGDFVGTNKATVEPLKVYF